MKLIALLFLIANTAWAVPQKFVDTQSETVTLLDGKSVIFKSLIKTNKPTLMIFGCNHCPYVKAWKSRIAELGAMAQQKGFNVLMINSNDDKSVAEDDLKHMNTFSSENHFQFQYVMDQTSHIAKKFEASRTPEAYLYSASQDLFYHGAIDDNADDQSQVKSHFLKDAIEALSLKKSLPKDKSETKFIGCSIKFRKG